MYGLELQKALRRQANSLKRNLRNLKIRVHLANRITEEIALVSWGSEDGKLGAKESIMIGDCYPLDTRGFGHFRLSGEKLEDHGKHPTTVHMFTKMARQQSRLFAAAYGEEHFMERLNDVDRMDDIHEECPEFFTVSFLSEMWGEWYSNTTHAWWKEFTTFLASTPNV